MVIRRLARPTPPSELPCGSLSRPFPKVSVHPSGCLCSLPRNRPVAWFPASARWHVFSAALRLPPSLPLMSPFGLPAAGYPASARWHVFSAALRLPRSLPLISPFGLPAAGYPASARWHVFSAALRLPRSLPLISPFGLPAAGYPASARWHVFRFPVSGFCFQPPPRSPRLRVSPFPVFLPPFESSNAAGFDQKQ